MYIREAHAADGWWPQASGAAACNVKQPKNQEERFEVAQQCRQALKMSVPLLVDTMDDFVGQAYSGGPDRLYIVDREGRVAYKGGRGPFGFRPLEMEQSLVMLLEEENSKRTSTFSPTQERTQEKTLERTQGRIPVLSNDAAWARLPGAPAKVETLPNWAKQLAGPLPQATAQMLKLDAQHRTGNHLDPKLRAKMRWIAADANGCAYAKAVAESDLKKAGATPEDFNGLGRDLGPLSEAEKAALNFAKKLTVEGASVTDGEVKTLLRYYGDKQVVGMVALIAHACFQDRVLVALDPPIEKEGPPGPVATVFPHKRTPPPSAPPMTTPMAAAGQAGAATPPPAAKPPIEPALGSTLAGADAEWKDKTFGDLLAGLDSQRQREGRIRVPDWSEVEAGDITANSWGLRLPRVLWNRVCYTHQPDLTDGWFDCVDAFRQESKMDRILSQDIFWVVTRSINCFY